METEKALSCIQEADTDTTRQQRLLSKALLAVEHTDLDEAYSKLAEAYNNCLKAAMCISQAMYSVVEEQELHKRRDLRLKGADISIPSLTDLSMCRYLTPHIFHCTLLTPPLLKRNANKDPYYRMFCNGLHANAAKACEGHSLFKKCVVCFVNHVAERAGGVTPYYDNDNMAIKGILDSVVPYVCPDDAVWYTDNVYLTQEDERNFAELFIIDDGYFGDWMALYPEYNFVKSLTKNQMISYG